MACARLCSKAVRGKAVKGSERPSKKQGTWTTEPSGAKASVIEPVRWPSRGAVSLRPS